METLSIVEKIIIKFLLDFQAFQKIKKFLYLNSYEFL